MDYILLIPLGIIVLFAIINCAVRGFKRSLVRLAFVLLAAVIAFFVAPLVAGYVAKIEPIFNYAEGSILQTAGSMGPSLSLATKGLPKAIWSVAAYPLVFLLLCIIMAIPSSIINRKLPKDKKGLGALLGIAVGIVVFTLALSPICSVATMALDVLPEDYIDPADIEELAGYVGLDIDGKKMLEQNKLTRMEGSIGQTPLKLLTRVKGNGKSISISEELSNLLPLADVYDGDLNKLPELLDAFVKCSENSSFINDAFDELQDTARQKWSNEEAFLGYDPKEPDDELMGFLAAKIIDNKQNMTIKELSEMIHGLFELMN